MKALREQIASWEYIKQSTNDEVMVIICHNVIKKLKRRNFLFDLIDIFCKALGILIILGGMGMFYHGLFADKPLGLVLGAILIYFGFKTAKGLEK